MKSAARESSTPDTGEELSRQIQLALDRGLARLHQRQLPSGEFPVYLLPDLPRQQGWMLDGCIFPTALIANCLLALSESSLREEMLTRATDFLVEQVHGHGLWSHFIIGHGLRGTCGPDADDTACVSAVLKARGITAPLGGNVRLLLANRNAKGLFYTWFVTRFCRVFDPVYWRIVLSEWRHPRTNLRYWFGVEAVRNGVDGVVNANVLYYLGDIPETQAVIDYLRRIVANGDEARCDYWYLDPNVIYYFFSRNYARGISKLEPARQPMIDRIRSSARPDGRLGETVLETAMGACALLHLGVPAAEVAPTVRFLLQAQLPDGDWPRGLLYYGGPKRRTAWGSEELSSGFCLEALARFQAAAAAS